MESVGRAGCLLIDLAEHSPTHSYWTGWDMVSSASMSHWQKKSSKLLYPAVLAAHTANSEGLSVRKGEHYKYMQGCHIPDSWKCVEN